MWFKRTKPPLQLSEELVQRVWDLSGQIKQLEDRIDAALEDLERRYRRAEQGERRWEAKQKGSDCEDEEGSVVRPGASQYFSNPLRLGASDSAARRRGGSFGTGRATPSESPREIVKKITDGAKPNGEEKDAAEPK